MSTLTKRLLHHHLTPLRHFSSSSSKPPTNLQNPPSPSSSLDEIRRNLSEFRKRSNAPPPPSSPITLQELYTRNLPDKQRPFDSIRESLRQLQSTNPPSISRIRETLKLKNETNADDNGMLFNRTPLFFGKDRPGLLGETSGSGGEFVRMYSHQDLGKKLKMLRPEKKKGNWFSIQELNDRLVKLREIEQDERAKMIGIGGAVADGLREGLVKLTLSNNAKAKEARAKKDTLYGLYVLGHPAGTSNLIMSPPKEKLVEKYFHPDNMSAGEKLKLELKKVREEFKMSESDCGSARVQVAQLTTKIKYLSSVLKKKDKHSRKGLQEMVQRRKKLLKYLRRTDWDSYCLVLSKLGLRDNPDMKA